MVDLNIISVVAWFFSLFVFQGERRWDLSGTWKIRYLTSYPIEHHPYLLGHISLLNKKILLDVGYPRIWYSLRSCLLGTVLLEMLHSYQFRIFLRQFRHIGYSIRFQRIKFCSAYAFKRGGFLPWCCIHFLDILDGDGMPVFPEWIFCWWWRTRLRWCWVSVMNYAWEQIWSCWGDNSWRRR